MDARVPRASGNCADGEIVRSRSPDAEIKFRRALLAVTTVANKPGTPGRTRISRNTIAQGMPDCFGVPVVTCLRAFFIARKAAGAPSARHSLRPLTFRGTPTMHHPGEITPRECGGLSSRHCEEQLFDRLNRKLTRNHPGRPRHA